MVERMTAGQVGQGNWWTEGIPSIQDQLIAGDAAEDIANDIMIHADGEHIELENSREEIIEWIEGLRPLGWRELEIHEVDGYLGHLGELVDDAPTNLDSCELADDGSIDTWPDHMVAAPGEEPAWDTPRCDVDWIGFAAALTMARGANAR